MGKLNQVVLNSDKTGLMEKFIQSTAARNGWGVQRDARLLQRLINSLADNLERHGRPYCPCKSHIPIDTTHDTICPCHEASDEIASIGRCECGLFIDANAIQAKRRSGLLATILCPGCASKLNRAQLMLALSRVPNIPDSRVLVGNSTADDAGIFLISPDRALVQTVDVLAPVADDPYTYGKIAAVNSLSDVWAMGGKPLSALGIIGFPYGGDTAIMSEILRGGQDAVVEAGAAVVGGHSFASDEIRYGLAVTGEIDPCEIYTNANAKPGDALVLTKPLGVGTVVSAIVQRGALPGPVVSNVNNSMLKPNRRASEAMRKFKAHACTDVTGFGLLGHGCEMAIASGVKLLIDSSSLPILSSALDLLREGVKDGAARMNFNSFGKYIDFDQEVKDEIRNLLFNSETSGGLLISLPHSRAMELVKELTDGGDTAVIIGEVGARRADDRHILVKN